FGRIWFLSLKRSGATYSAEKRLFLEAAGENGFAPTALAVHPITGDLFASIGGRGTRGAVYRIRHAERFNALSGGPARVPALPHSPLAWQSDMAESFPRLAVSNNAWERCRALAAVRRHQSQFDDSAIARIVRANWDHSDRLVRLMAAELLR